MQGCTWGMLGLEPESAAAVAGAMARWTAQRGSTWREVAGYACDVAFCAQGAPQAVMAMQRQRLHGRPVCIGVQQAMDGSEGPAHVLGLPLQDAAFFALMDGVADALAKGDAARGELPTAPGQAKVSSPMGKAPDGAMAVAPPGTQASTLPADGQTPHVNGAPMNPAIAQSARQPANAGALALLRQLRGLQDGLHQWGTGRASPVYNGRTRRVYLPPVDLARWPAWAREGLASGAALQAVQAMDPGHRSIAADAWLWLLAQEATTAGLPEWLSSSSAFGLRQWPDFGSLPQLTPFTSVIAAMVRAPLTPQQIEARSAQPTRAVHAFLTLMDVQGLLKPAAAPAIASQGNVAHAAPAFAPRGLTAVSETDAAAPAPATPAPTPAPVRGGLLLRIRHALGMHA